MRENVRQQQDASSGHSVGAPADVQPGTGQHGNAATPLLDTLIAGAGGAASGLWGGTGEFIDTVGDAVGDGLGWLGGRASGATSNLADAGGDVLGGLRDVGGLGWDFLSTGEPPSVTELISGGTVLLAAGVNASVALSTAGLLHPAPAR
ncbi:MAG TPA: hypothetical protein VF885_03475 [Arthrobacter sp.]